jgi:hypothetical protein
MVQGSIPWSSIYFWTFSLSPSLNEGSIELQLRWWFILIFLMSSDSCMMCYQAVCCWHPDKRLRYLHTLFGQRFRWKKKHWLSGFRVYILRDMGHLAPIPQFAEPFHSSNLVSLPAQSLRAHHHSNENLDVRSARIMAPERGSTTGLFPS